MLRQSMGSRMFFRELILETGRLEKKNGAEGEVKQDPGGLRNSAWSLEASTAPMTCPP